MASGALPRNWVGREEGEGRCGYQPAADAALLIQDVRNMTKKGESLEFAGLTLGEVMGKGVQGERRHVMVIGGVKSGDSI